VLLAVRAAMLAIKNHRRLLCEAFRAAPRKTGFSQEKLDLSPTLRDPAWLLKKPSFWPPDPPTLPLTILRDAPDPRRILAVSPLIADKRCYGEYPARVRCGYGGMSGR